MKSKLVLADYIANHMDVLTEHLVNQTGMAKDDILLGLVRKWLENNVAVLREKPCRIAEWAAQFVERNRALNILTGEAYLCLKALQKSLTERCLGKVEGATDAEILSTMNDNAVRFEQAVVEYFAQRVRQDTVANQRRQKAILESVNMPMALIDDEGGVEMVNKEFCRLLKTSPDMLEGVDLTTLCNEETASRLRSFLRQKRMDQSKTSFQGEISFGTQKIRAEIACQPFFNADGMRTGAAVFIDQNGRDDARVETGIQYLEERLLPLVTLPMQLFDREGNITFSSEQAALFSSMGYDRTEPLCCFLYRRRYGDKRECLCKEAFDSGLFHLDEISLDTQTEIKWFRLVIIPLQDDAGHISRVACCVYDMTHRRQVQKQLESQIINQQRSSLVAQLSITVAHQLRNPLSVVLGFAEMMAKGLAPDQYAEAVSRILRNSLRCKDIVENLLDFGKGMPLERRPVDFEVLIRESVRTLLTPSQNRIIDWRFSGKPAPIECVPEQMSQVVLSLLDNALRMAQRQVVCSVENKGDLIRLRIVDDGPGIPLDLREHVFEPFFTTRREEGATGLGLSLARAVASDYGGSLTVSVPAANEPRGACLVLQLPLMKKQDAGKNEEPAKPVEIKEKLVLVVDDETDLQDLLKTTLYMRGYRADTVATGMEALQKIKENEYSAVVLDYLIKGSLTGQQLYREITEQYPHLVPRVLFITADMLNYQTRLFMESTGRPVLEKPFLMADFIMELNKVMG